MVFSRVPCNSDLSGKGLVGLPRGEEVGAPGGKVIEQESNLKYERFNETAHCAKLT